MVLKGSKNEEKFLSFCWLRYIEGMIRSRSFSIGNLFFFLFWLPFKVLVHVPYAKIRYSAQLHANLLVCSVEIVDLDYFIQLSIVSLALPLINCIMS